MPRFAPIAAIRRTLARGEAKAVADQEISADTADTELADAAETVTGAADDDVTAAPDEAADLDEPKAADESVATDDADGVAEPTEAGGSFATAALGHVVPKAKALVPPRHRWRPLFVGGLRLLILSPKAPSIPLVLASVAAAAWAVVVGLVCGWGLAAAGAVSDPANVAPWLWLVGNHVGFTTGEGTAPVTLLPLGLLAISVLPLRRVGRFLAAEYADVGRGAAVMAGISYLLLAVVVAASWGDGYFAALPTAIAASLCAGLGIAWGWRRQVREARSNSPLLVGVLWTIAAPLVVAVMLVVIAAIANGGQVIEVQQQLASTPGEHIGLILLQIGYLPNLLIWTACYALGSGVTFGTETISPFADGAPLLPDLPLLYLLPEQSPRWTAALPILLVLGAAWGAMRMNRRQPSYPLTARLVRAAALAGTAAALWFLLVRVSGGSLAVDRLEYVGPATGTTLVAFLVFLAGALGWALLPTIAADARPAVVDLRDRVTRTGKHSESVAAQDSDSSKAAAPHPASRRSADS